MHVSSPAFLQFLRLSRFAITSHLIQFLNHGRQGVPEKFKDVSQKVSVSGTKVLTRATSLV